MNGRTFRAGNDVGFRWVLAGLAAMAAVPVTAAGAERVVLGEEFTATW